MSISRKQIERKLNQLIKGEIKDGLKISLNRILSKLSAYFVEHPPGKPSMKVRPAEYRGKSKPEDWNKMVDEIHEDLHVLYSETIDQTERILKNFNYAEVERKKIERRLDKALDRITETLLLNTKANGVLYSEYDTFKDLEKVNTEKTDAEIDFKHDMVTLGMSKVGNKKLDIEPSMLSGELVNEDIEGKEVEGLANMLDDKANTSWVYEAQVGEIKKVSYKITIDLEDMIDPCTRISVTPHSDIATELRIRYTEDGNNWRELTSKRSNKAVVWDFNKMYFKKIELIITKNDYSYKDDKKDKPYIYRLGIKDFSMLKVDYEPLSNFYSKPIAITDRTGRDINISKLSLKTDQHVPSGAQIKWRVAEYIPGSEPNWINISPVNVPNPRYDQVIDFKSISSPNRITWENDVASYREEVYGISFHDVYSFPNTNQLIKDSIKVYKGVNQWRKEKYEHEWEDELFRIPDNIDWINPPVKPHGITTSYTRADGGTFPIESSSDSNNYRFTTNMKVSQNQTITATLSTNIKTPCAVYVNHQKVFERVVGPSTPKDHRTYTIDLAGGRWNTIHILVSHNAKDHDDPNTATTLNLDPGFNPVQEAYGSSSGEKVNVLGVSEPMREVSYFDLTKTVPADVTNCFAIAEQSNGAKKIVINQATKLEGARCKMTYKYFTASKDRNKILLWAELSKTSEASNPIINSWTVRASLDRPGDIKGGSA